MQHPEGPRFLNEDVGVREILPRRHNIRVLRNQNVEIRDLPPVLDQLDEGVISGFFGDSGRILTLRLGWTEYSRRVTPQQMQKKDGARWSRPFSR
jgi:hypothetical protein